MNRTSKITKWQYGYLILIAAGLLLDQVSKYFAQVYLNFYTPLWIVPKRLSFQLVHNFGAAYGIFQHQRLFLLGISMVVILGCIIFYKKIAVNRMTSIGLSFVLIGAVGNFIDRLLRGFVVDFIDIKIFPVFNVADMCIDIGIFFFFIDVLFQIRTIKSSRL